MSIAFRGLTLDLSWLQISDVIALIFLLIVTSFNLIPEKKIPNKWIRRLIILGGSGIFLIGQYLIFHNLLHDIAPITNSLPASLEVRWYGVLIMAGAVAATFLAAWGAGKRDIDKNYVWDMMPWLLLAGIIGARLWHVFTPSQMDQVNNQITTAYYMKNPLEIFAIWRGGLGIPGAVMGGAFAAWIYCRIKKIKFGDLADVVSPGLALAQAIGRWGNYFNQELYGLQAEPPLGVSIHNFDANGNLGSVVGTFLPIFWYESAWNLINMGLLLYLLVKTGKKLLSGDIFLIYISFYSLGRFLLEFIRADISVLGNTGININQTLMAILFVLSISFLIVRKVIHDKGKNESVDEQLLVESPKSAAAKKAKMPTDRSVGLEKRPNRESGTLRKEKTAKAASTNAKKK